MACRAIPIIAIMQWQETVLGKVDVRLVVVIDTLKAVEYVSIDSPKVNLSAESGLLLSEERNRSQLNTLLVQY